MAIGEIGHMYPHQMEKQAGVLEHICSFYHRIKNRCLPPILFLKIAEESKMTNMKSKWFEIALALILLLIGPCTAAWAQEKKNDIFNIAPAVAFSWYPYANFMTEKSTNTEFDLNNFGMSVIMGLKLFDKVGAHLNLKIDDPTFKKLVDVAGYLTAYYFMIKFDYHSFGGTVTWKGDTPNPIPDEVYNFHNQWINVSLLFRVDQLKIRDKPSVFEIMLFSFLHEWLLIGEEHLGAIGIGYAKFDMPLEYRVQPDRGLSNPGFGLVKGEAWGLSILWDTLARYIELPAYQRNRWQQHIWVYINFFNGSSPNEETDAQAIAWMSNANNGVSVDGNINFIHYALFKMIFGFQYVWDVGKKGRIGLAVGVEFLEEEIDANNKDIAIEFNAWHIGPVVRVSAYW